MKFALCIVLLLSTLESRAQTGVVVRAGPMRARLVELFTSEGCNSCPPAEEWMSGLLAKPGLWTNFVPLAFHVDYWDYLGWRDRFSRSAFTARQSAYVRTWRGDTMYTPCIALDGSPWKSWRQLDAPPALRAEKTGVLELETRGANSWFVRFAPTGTGPWQFHAAQLGIGISVAVKAGENAGRTLRHDFTVLNYTNGPLAATDPPSAEFALGPPAEIPPQTGIAIWITRRNSAVPVQAGGGMLK